MTTLKRAMEGFRYTIGSNERYFTLRKGIHAVDLLLIGVGIFAILHIVLNG